MSRWHRIREFLAVGADIFAVATGLGVIVAALVGLLNQASLHIAEPWLAMILLGVFLVVAGLVARGLRYLPQPISSGPKSASKPVAVSIPPGTRLMTGPPIPIPPLHVAGRVNELKVFLAITNKDEMPADTYADA